MKIGLLTIGTEILLGDTVNTNLTNLGKRLNDNGFKLENYTLPGNCPSWKTISNHFLMIWHLKELGLLDQIVKSFGNWDQNNPKLTGGSENDLEIAYDLFRYRKFTRDEVIELNDKTNNI